MWSSRVSYGVRANYLNKLRAVRHLQSGVKDSYLKNPGSEPLTTATLGQVLAETVNKYPGRVAIRSVHEDVTITYEQLLNQADSLGCALRAQGLQKGDRLGLWSHNAAAWLVTYVAAARVGLIPVLLNPVYEKPELSFCIKKTGIKGLLINDKLPNKDYYGMLREMIPELQTSKPGALRSDVFPTLTTVITAGKEQLPGTLSYDSLITYNNNDATKYGAEIKPEEGCIIHLTSGTTGEPKAALDSHNNVVNNTYFIGKRNSLHEEHHRVCLQAPLFHALGSIVTTLAGLRHGSTLVLAAPSYNVHSNINAWFAEKCTLITGTPTMFIDLLAQVKNKGETPPPLRIALAAGAPCSPQLIKDMQQYLNTETVKALYGLTETTASVFQSLPGDSTELVSETVGYIQDHVEVKVVDDNGNVLPFGSSGELVVRGYLNMIGYWDEPEKTRKAFYEGGWLRTGDKFTISEDGYGRIVGRLKDIIVRGGENIAPKEIEDLLNTHPSIIDSQVIGVSDERLGEELCAVLRLREGSTVTPDDLRRHCTGHLAKFKIPRIIKVIDEFPKTTSGKIQKYKLKEIIEAGKL
ncbi:medium-chain acyl-CoA ligase ACSF2, mitochondrial [Galleria mellonella]|uniref:Medium-chain acyl-CoA ligase ACSF2, mitochondrial n=1 Tax=Galleria mellonella TaxID=7137 RepID=A0ABM3MU44_GALME|nr:medium-chain acyl-CoA ligase ACSF2, mitochondrial [Galleria mellonella]